MKEVVALVVGFIILAMLLFMAARRMQAQTFPSGFGQGYNMSDPKIIYTMLNYSNTPGWYPPGSLWIRPGTNGGTPATFSVYIQTNNWNTNGFVILSNVVIFGGVTNVNIAGTNIYPIACWASNGIWATVPPQ